MVKTYKVQINKANGQLYVNLSKRDGWEQDDLVEVNKHMINIHAKMEEFSKSNKEKFQCLHTFIIDDIRNRVVNEDYLLMEEIRRKYGFKIEFEEYDTNKLHVITKDKRVFYVDLLNYKLLEGEDVPNEIESITLKLFIITIRNLVESFNLKFDSYIHILGFLPIEPNNFSFYEFYYNTSNTLIFPHTEYKFNLVYEVAKEKIFLQSKDNLHLRVELKF